MRVITGKARGKKLISPEGMNIRPTTDMAKEAIFSIIHFEIEQASILDLFAGSGQLGIEALSRGARFCVFVDSSREAQEIVRKNVADTGFSAQSRVVAMDYQSFLQSTKDVFDIVFIDPPYEKNIAQTALPLVAQKMSDSGIIICETAKTEQLPDTAGSFAKKKEYRYGKTKITTYRKIEE